MTGQQEVLGNQGTITVAGKPIDPTAEQRRRKRSDYGWRLRKLNSDMFPRRQIGKCGLPLAEVTVGHRTADGRAAIGNVSTCGSVHGCLRCAAMIRAERAAEIGHCCRSHLGAGLAIEFATLTFPHWGIDRLLFLIEGLREAWRKMTQRKPYAHLKAEFDIAGMIRSTEFTWSLANGWHPHLHILFFLDRPDLDPDEHMEFRALLYQAWQAIVGEVLPGREVHKVYGVDLRPVRDDAGIGEYVSKIELEMTRSDLKTNRERASNKGSRTPWQIATDFMDNGDTTDKRLWREYVEATHGLRIMGISPSLRKRYGKPARTDEEIAADSTELNPVVNVSAEVFMAARKNRTTAVIPEMIAAFETGGINGAVAVLSRLGPIIVEDRSAVGDLPLIRFRTEKPTALGDLVSRTTRAVRKTQRVVRRPQVPVRNTQVPVQPAPNPYGEAQ